MNCNQAEKVSLLIDGELSPSEAKELESHLVQCGECRALRSDFLSLRSQLVAYEVSFEPAAQRHALADILGRSTNPSATPSGGWLGFHWTPARAVLAFASLLLVGLIVGVSVYRHSVLRQSDQYIARDNRPGSTQAEASNASKNQPPRHQSPPATKDRNRLQRSAPVKTMDKSRKNPPIIIPADPFVAQELPEPEDNSAPRIRAADAETLTAMHLEKSELLLRAFRNVRLDEPGMKAEVGYEKRRAQQLVYQNMLLRREADAAGDVQVATLLENLEPILIDIANLPDQPDNDDIRVIKDRVERKNIVPLLQVNSTALAKALD